MEQIQCFFCEAIFKVKNYRKNSAKYCSLTCKVKHKQAPIEKIVCISCNLEFNREKWKIKNSSKGKYCSKQCYLNRSSQPVLECICGTIFKSYQSIVFFDHRLFCSQKCYLKNHFFSELSDDISEISNYGNFISRLRSSIEYLTWKEKCLKRDNYVCKCGISTNITVHHIVSIYDLVKKYGLSKENIEKDIIFFDITNGETVCKKCHLAKHRKQYE